jgi:dephospho-CoA kinase
MTPKVIGLTGNIGAGKSTVARYLVARGAALVDADALAREASGDPAVLEAIAEQLGADLVVNGQLERARTAQRIFRDEAARRALEGIIHPWVRRESARRVAALQAATPPPPFILLDIPLLYENGLERDLDAVIVVTAPLAARVRRVAARSGLSEAEVRARDAAQMPLEAKAARADFVLDNSGDEASLEGQLEALWHTLAQPAE